MALPPAPAPAADLTTAAEVILAECPPMISISTAADVPNRADRRRDGHRLPVTDTLPIQRRNPVSRNRRRHPEAVSA